MSNRHIVLAAAFCLSISPAYAQNTMVASVRELLNFWAIAPTVFDADSAAPAARALYKKFQKAATVFRERVADGTSDTVLVDRERERFYLSLSKSEELLTVLRVAYEKRPELHPFMVNGWSPRKAP
ncbi:MAG: hypothetical protein ABIW79_03295 [Gemmatimonas sp.]